MSLGSGGFSDWQYWEDLPKEKEEELLEKMAKYIVDHNAETLAELFFGTIEPVGRMGAQLGLTILGPYFEFFNTAHYMAVFRKRGNIRRLLDRIEELRREKEKPK